MLQEPISDPDGTTAGDLRDRYVAAIAAVADEVGVETAAERTGIDAERLAEAEQRGGEFTLEEAASVLALAEDTPDEDALLLEVRDRLMLGMSGAVLDVDALARGLDGDFEPRDVQQKIEGRQPMTLDEYARIRHFVAERAH